MKKINKETSKSFVKQMTTFFLTIGATEVPTIQGYSKFTLESAAGQLKINVPLENSDDFTIFSCFENPEKANKFSWFLGVGNPYSGKYNFHANSSKNLSDVVNDATFFFTLTLKHNN